jgi:hypothetical protein
MEYVDSIDELAYITSLEQQNYELLAALRAIVQVLKNDETTSEWGGFIRSIESAIDKATP